MTQILLLQGANMRRLGKRQPALYGSLTKAALDKMMTRHAAGLGLDLDIVYTDIEGEAAEAITSAYDDGVRGLLMNPAGFTYNGYALRDCILDCAEMRYVEVHMTNLARRGSKSVLAEAADGLVMGFGAESYRLGLDALARMLAN